MCECVLEGMGISNTVNFISSKVQSSFINADNLPFTVLEKHDFPSIFPKNNHVSAMNMPKKVSNELQ